MSDNGIYILKTPVDEKEEQWEYRVIEATEIEKIWSQDANGDARQVVEYFGKTKVERNEEVAQEVAKQVYNICIKQGETIEHGIKTIVLHKPFSEYVKEFLQIKEIATPFVVDEPKST